MRMLYLYVALFLVSGFFFWWLGQSDSATARTIEISRTSLSVEREQPLAAIGNAVQRSTGLRELGNEVPAAEVNEGNSLKPTELDLEGAILRGRVVNDETFEPWGACSLLVKGVFVGGPKAYRVDTDIDGAFEATLPTEFGEIGAYIHLMVREVGGTRDLLSRHVRLDADMTIRVSAPKLLRGRVEFTPSSAMEDVIVRVDEVTDSGAVGFLGQGTIDESGKFGFLGRPHEWARQAKVSTFVGRTLLDARRVPMDDLLEGDGVEIGVQWSIANIRVETVGGTRIAGADVHVVLAAPEPSLPTSGITNENGEVGFPLAVGNYEFAVSARGYVPFLSASGFQVEERVVLNEVSASGGGTVRGVVMHPDGKAVAKALVTMRTKTRNVELGSKVTNIQVRTSQDGRFELIAPYPGQYEIGAFHREQGSSVFGEVEVPTERSVRIYMDELGTLELDLAGDVLVMDGFDGAVDYLILNKRRTEQDAGTWRIPPYVRSGLPVGEYVALLRVPSVGMFGAIDCSVSSDAFAGRVAIEINAPRRASGYLVDKSGVPVSGALIEVLPRGIYGRAPRDWRETRTQSSGWYDVPVFEGGGAGAGGLRAYVTLDSGASTEVMLSRESPGGRVVVEVK